MKTVFKGVHGSRLYGTENKNSDWDYKNIFTLSLSELITGHDDCFREHQPNDIEFFSVKKFALLLSQQQTNAIEILFTPDKFVIETSPAFEELRANKHKLVSKDIMPFIGYAKQQARVYSEKGNSFNLLKELNADLNRWLCYHVHDKDTKAIKYTDGQYASIVLPKLMETYPQLISRGQKLSNTGVPILYVEILNKQFECLVSILEWKQRIQIMIDTYGERAKQAAVNGAFDRKAMYHAVRIVAEAVELLETGELLFPTPKDTLVLLKAIRYDENVSFEEAQGLLMDRYNHLMEVALPKSTLQETIDKEYLKDWYISTQTSYIKEEFGIV